MKAKYLKEYFFFPDILIMSVLFLVSFGFMIPHLTSISIWIAFVVGMIAYSIVEYLTHRFLFHIKTPKSPFLLNIVKRLHYDHHANPNDLSLLFLPVWYSLPNMAIAAVVAYLITSSLVITNAFIAGIMIFLLFYEWTHYIAHRPINPISSWGRWMKKVHLWHHFKNENYWYGVTNPVYDLALGTFKDKNKVELSPTARDLEKRGKQNIQL
ncbi:sterol desaturase family protein [Paenibacillus sp. KQZ6P-2]|uniref:Sterol desaturase family protein n=1 Tax=Paenibacillus mangrovi TaxID=2931978 RepID=A0A9X2B4A8_9BACL|nr:sterol desaturase family protein [Paenibacillus mangrovi]MCJ8010878.1 sterol desaturase family protein [Paenibacillus mangrovi]